MGQTPDIAKRLTLIQLDLLRRIIDTTHFGFSTQRLKLSDRRALAALFEQGLVTPQSGAEAKVVATRAGRVVSPTLVPFKPACSNRKTPRGAASSEHFRD